MVSSTRTILKQTIGTSSLLRWTHGIDGISGIRFTFLLSNARQQAHKYRFICECVLVGRTTMNTSVQHTIERKKRSPCANKYLLYTPETDGRREGPILGGRFFHPFFHFFKFLLESKGCALPASCLWTACVKRNKVFASNPSGRLSTNDCCDAM